MLRSNHKEQVIPNSDCMQKTGWGGKRKRITQVNYMRLKRNKQVNFKLIADFPLVECNMRARGIAGYDLVGGHEFDSHRAHMILSDSVEFGFRSVVPEIPDSLVSRDVSNRLITYLPHSKKPYSSHSVSCRHSVTGNPLQSPQNRHHP